MDKKQVSNEECMYQSMFNFVVLCRINVSESESQHVRFEYSWTDISFFWCTWNFQMSLVF